MEMMPQNVEIKFWVGVTLASLGKVDESIPLFRDAFRADGAWRELLGRMYKPGLMPNTDAGHAAVDRILREAK